MPTVPQPEVQPHLVIHVDTEALRAIGGSETNAELAKTGDRAVQGPHYFLVVERKGNICTAVPLFSAWTPGAEQLLENKKSGLPDKWLGQQSFFNRWQHWRIPVAAVEAASAQEESHAGNRRRYATGEPMVLEAILVWQHKNRAPFRAA